MWRGAGLPRSAAVLIFARQPQLLAGRRPSRVSPRCTGSLYWGCSHKHLKYQSPHLAPFTASQTPWFSGTIPGTGFQPSSDYSEEKMWGAGNENQGPRIEERSSRMCVCVCKQETLVVLPPLTLRWRITVLYFSNYVNSTRLKMRSILSLTILITNLRGENWEDDDEIKWK